jgi:hypothetical protein
MSLENATLLFKPKANVFDLMSSADLSQTKLHLLEDLIANIPHFYREARLPELRQYHILIECRREQWLPQ